MSDPTAPVTRDPTAPVTRDPTALREALEAVRSLSEAATPGPWGRPYSNPFIRQVDADGNVTRYTETIAKSSAASQANGIAEVNSLGRYGTWEADADLIVAAVNFVRAALAAPPAAPSEDAAWEALYEALSHSHLGVTDRAVIARHRPRIEEAIRRSVTNG